MRGVNLNIKELPSWEYFTWGIINGLLIGLSLKYGLDISEAGIMEKVVTALKPIIEMIPSSTNWISYILLLIGVVGTISTAVEAIKIFKHGWPARIIAICGFASILLILLGVHATIGAVLMIVGIVMIILFPY